ncbi:g5874 [Coccomyxa viridis]|uniref:G5874 protein n=1 Tax=Coccomyxa viridis TaxID=1274662 RepID=A0ABP1FWM0_9CHLO
MLSTGPSAVAALEAPGSIAEHAAKAATMEMLSTGVSAVASEEAHGSSAEHAARAAPVMKKKCRRVKEATAAQSRKVAARTSTPGAISVGSKSITVVIKPPSIRREITLSTPSSSVSGAGRSARAATSARRQNRCTLALENLIEGRLTSLRFFRASYETDGFEFSATSKALKKLVASLDGSILAHLIPLTAGWTGYMDGRKEWYWVPDEGYIKYLQTAVAYLIRRFQYDNAEKASKGAKQEAPTLIAGTMAGLLLPN